MGILDFLTGGNPKVVARYISQLHTQYGGDYQAVYDAVALNMYSGSHTKGILKSMTISSELPKVNNYAELGVLYLYYGASPDNADWHDIRVCFQKDVEKYLRKMGVPDKYVNGKNEIVNY